MNKKKGDAISSALNKMISDDRNEEKKEEKAEIEANNIQEKAPVKEVKPKKTKKISRTLAAFKIENELLNEFRDYCSLTNENQSAIVEDLLAKFMKSEKVKTKIKERLERFKDV